jgi:hypothetical protein
VVPYSTWVVEAWSVVQVMVTLVGVGFACNTVITGGTGLAAVAKVTLEEVVSAPEEFAERTA